MGIFISVIIGVLLAFCGIAYKIGSIGKASPVQCLPFLALPGCLFYALLGASQWHTVSWLLALLCVLFGFTQYFQIRLLRYALTLGPLSPAWCAQALNFILVIIYSSCVLNEPLSVFQYGALFATVGAIIASVYNADSGKGQKAETVRKKILYGLALIALLVTNSIFQIGLKFCSANFLPGMKQPISESSGNAVLSLTYLFILISSSLDLTICHNWKFNRYACTGGALLAVCAITACGLSMLIVSKVPAMILFVLSNAISILGASLLSVFFFHEKRSRAWYWTIGFSLLAILLNR